MVPTPQTCSQWANPCSLHNIMSYIHMIIQSHSIKNNHKHKRTTITVLCMQETNNVMLVCLHSQPIHIITKRIQNHRSDTFQCGFKTGNFCLKQKEYRRHPFDAKVSNRNTLKKDHPSKSAIIFVFSFQCFPSLK